MTDERLNEALERERRNYEMTQEDANLLSHELYLSRGLGGIAEEAENRLRSKCNWEHMTRTAVLMNYGHPYDWP